MTACLECRVDVPEVSMTPILAEASSNRVHKQIGIFADLHSIGVSSDTAPYLLQVLMLKTDAFRSAFFRIQL